MHFKEFITRQRVAITIVGIAIFIVSLLISNSFGYKTLWGELFVDLAASALTIIFTALIVDYLALREQATKTINVASLAHDEIRAICMRIKWRMARLSGFTPGELNREDISSRQQAGEYLEKTTEKVNEYLSSNNFDTLTDKVNEEDFARYQERLQSSQNELEQTLVLYEYALSYTLRELILELRSELQIADRLLSFIDTSEPLTRANRSLIKVTSKSIYEAVENVLEYSPSIPGSSPLHARAERITKTTN